jgi:hypothetical protein
MRIEVYGWGIGASNPCPTHGRPPTLLAVTWLTRFACLTLLLLGPAWLRQVHACATHVGSHAITCSDHDHHHGDAPQDERQAPAHDGHGCLQCDALQAMSGMVPCTGGTLASMHVTGTVDVVPPAVPERPRPWRTTLAQPPPHV